MTLVEILVAMAVSALVLLAAVAVYWTLMESLRRQQISRQNPAYAALEQVRLDLSQCAQVPSTNMPTFVLESQFRGSNIPQISSIAFSAGSLSSPDAPFSNLEVSRIRYTVIAAKAGEGMLIRETMNLWGSNALAPAVSNAILEHVTAFEVSVLSGGGWTNNWISTPRMLLPGAARVRMDWQNEALAETASLEVFIPAGNVVPGGKMAP